jgi:hypothetical protein
MGGNTPPTKLIRYYAVVRKEPEDCMVSETDVNSFIKFETFPVDRTVIS